MSDRIVLTDNTLDSLGAILQKKRMDAALSQEEVAKMAGKVQPYIAQMESLVYKGMKLPTLRPLVAYLDAIGHQLVIEKK